MNTKYTPGPAAKLHVVRGLTQMCDHVNTTVASVGAPDADGAKWWLFSDAPECNGKETAARLALCWNTHDQLVEALQKAEAALQGAALGLRRAARCVPASALEQRLSIEECARHYQHQADDARAALAAVGVTP